MLRGYKSRKRKKSLVALTDFIPLKLADMDKAGS